jgi:hypothetical protein
MMVTRMFVLFKRSSLLVSSTLSTKYNIACPTRGMSLASMQQCPAAHQLGSSSTFTHILCIFAIQTARSFHPISLQHPQPQLRLMSIASFALVFHPRNDGYRLMPMTPSCAQYKTLHSTPLQSPTRPYLRSITIILHCCTNPSSLLRTICSSYANPSAEHCLSQVCSWFPLSSSISFLLPSIPIQLVGI